MYESLTRYLNALETEDRLGEIIVDRVHKGITDDLIQMPFVDYGKTVTIIEQAIYDFEKSHPEFGLTCYSKILESNGLKWEMHSMIEADVEKLDGETIMALLMGAVRAERFCDEALLEFCESGTLIRWLQRLEQIDESFSKRTEQE